MCFIFPSYQKSNASGIGGIKTRVSSLCRDNILSGTSQLCRQIRMIGDRASNVRFDTQAHLMANGGNIAKSVD